MVRGSLNALPAAALLLAALGGLAACTPQPAPAPEAAESEPQLVEASGAIFGTTWHAKWMADGPDPRLKAGIEVVLNEVDLHMSKWRDDSELSVARRTDGPVPVSLDTAAVVDAALDLAEQSGGAFDPTVEPLMRLWGFEGEKREDLPSDAEVQAALDRVGWSKVELRRSLDGATLDANGTSLDLGAIAKGHAVDRVHNLLAAEGLGSIFVEVGGEVRVSGPASGRPLWRVGVSLPDPAASPTDFALVVKLTNGAVATSGNYRNHYDVGGQRLVHTMDPRVGRPIETPVASATVIAPDCRTADGLATTLMVLPPDEGLALVSAMPDVEAALLLFDGTDFRLRTTPGMAGRFDVLSDRVQADPTSP